MLSRVPSGRARAACVAALALLALVAGYLDLSRGGTALASVLLTLGYCALVPAAILVWPVAGARPLPDDAGVRPPYLAAAIAAAAVLVLYLVTLAPSTAMWDTSEYLAAVKVLGLPHPPGNPLFVLLGHAWALLPLASSYAVRVNIMAAVASALSAGLWFLVAEHALARWLPARWQRIAGAAVAVVSGATAFTVWNQSVVNEKVYTIALLGIALVSWLVIRWSDDPRSPSATRRLVLAVYLTGLGYANHPAGFLAIPAIGIAVLAIDWTTLRRWRLVLAAVAMLGVGLTPFLYEPIRAGQFPVMNEGEPTACTTHFAWSCTLTGLTMQRLSDNINRTQYAKPSVLDRQAPFGAQLGMWWLYFRWQWLRDAAGTHAGLQSMLAVLFLGLGLAGAWAQWRHDRRAFWYFAPLVATVTIALIYYLNFKYGWSESPELGRSVPREVRDRDYFYLWSFSAWSVWVALGVALVWEALARLVEAARGARRAAPPAPPARVAWLAAAPVLLVACIPLVGNAHAAPRSGQRFTREWAHDVLESVAPYGILITNGDNDTFPLWYAQEVEGIRPDVTVAVTSYLGTDWFVRQIIRRPTPAFDSAAAPAIWRGRSWPHPDGPPLRMSFAEADSIPQWIVLRQPMRFRHGAIDALIPAGPLTRDQIVTLRMIADSSPERSVYFTAPGYAESIGLGPYLLTEGLVTRLMADTVRSTVATPAIPDGHLDVATTDTLWRDVYRGPRQLIAEGRWVDRASSDIPLRYLFTGGMLAAALAQRGETREAVQVMDTVRRMADAAGVDISGWAPAAVPPGGGGGGGDTAAR